MSDLKNQNLIFISPKEYESQEKEYFKSTYGFSDNMIFAENIEEGRMMTACNRGYLIVEETNKPKLPGKKIKRITLMKNGNRIERNLYAFYPKVTANEIKEDFVEILRKCYE